MISQCLSSTKYEPRICDGNAQRTLTAVHSRTSHIIEFTPPGKVLLSDKILEDEPDSEPRGVIYTRSRRNIRHPIEDNGYAHPFDPRVGVPPCPEPEWQRKESADNNGIEMWVVNRTSSELTRRTDETPAGTLAGSVQRSSLTYQTADAV